MGTRTKSWSVFEIKSVSEDQRVVEGLASTPETDRQNDVVEPMGAEFELPLPLLWQHNSAAPIGTVIRATPSVKGISVRLQIVKTDTPGTLKNRLDEAWESIKLGLVRGLSIGFVPLETARIKSSGTHYIRWRWLELSAVTIPCNASASITAIKSADAATYRAHRQRLRELPVVCYGKAGGVSYRRERS